MARYLAIIEEDAEQGVFFASFPDAPGCTASGKDQDEVLDNAADALSEWATDEIADGRELPRARSYVELLKSEEYGLGNNGMVAWVPLILETGKLVRANISMDAGVLTAIDQAAARHGVTRSAFLQAAARDKIKAEA